MKTFFLSPFLIFGLIYVLAETKKDVVYYVSPTEPLSSCHGSSSCPPGQLCHTMDYLAEHSSELFSPDHINVTLIFICGVHHYTKGLTVQNLHSFVMKGAAESRENVIIDHQFGTQVGKPKCTVIRFFSVSFVNITTLTMRCPAIYLEDSHITAKSSNLYGYPGISERLSFIWIAKRGSQALLDNCTFKENCFIMSDFSDGIIVSNSTFQLYRHQLHSIIKACSSVVILTGNVNFTDSSIVGTHSSYRGAFGRAVYLETLHSELKSSLNIITGATVYFVNLKSFGGGGAVFGKNAMIHIGAKARVVFMNNSAHYAGAHGGAVNMVGGMITVGAESCVIFTYNHARVPNGGGAISLQSATLIVDSEANLTFSHNSADFGGALVLMNSTLYVNTSGIKFYGNRATRSGGAIDFFYGIMIINTNKSVKFIMNSAKRRGGAIYIEVGVHPTIIVGNYSKLLFFNNYAFQGGALYSRMPSLLVATVEHQSSIQFINNTAFDVGGAVYSQSSLPCIFTIIDYSTKISFIRNSAQRGVGQA